MATLRQPHRVYTNSKTSRSLVRSVPSRQLGARQRIVQTAVALDVLAAVAPICFTQECQAEADRAFLLTLAIPMALAVAAAAYVARPPPQELKDSGQIFEDDSTGSVFALPEKDTEPERDKDGLLVFRPISYTPWPVSTDYEGERLRIPVGPVRDRKPRTYAFNKVLPQPSELLTVTLPRPLGVVFEYDQPRRRAVVVDVVEGSAAAQRMRVAGLNPRLAKETVRPGDVLRAATCTNFVYETKALWGAVPPERHVVLYGADKQSWANIRTALRKGEVKDGNVTLVLERRIIPPDNNNKAAAAAASTTSVFSSTLFSSSSSSDSTSSTTTSTSAEASAAPESSSSS